MPRSAVVGVALFGMILLGLTGAPATALAVTAPIPLFHGVSAVQSTNWAGYAVTASKGSVTDVKGSWVVPAIQGSCPATGSQYSSFWVGIDGYSSNSVEQTGTDSDCQSGAPTYYAWYEFYPHPSFRIGQVHIAAGDTIYAEVHYANGKFTLTLKDLSSGTSYTKSAKVNAARSSAEWIAEAPSSSGGILPLADFGTVEFGTDYTSTASTCYATVSGTTSAFGTFSAVSAITMVDRAGTQDKAIPSAVSSDQTSFTVGWQSAGP